MAERLVLVALVLVLAACGGSGDGGELTGEELAAEVGCLSCHQETSTDVAPSLHGIWATDVELADGRTVTVDEEYVTRSIQEPGADIVAGYEAIMPVFPLDPDEVDSLVDWVRSLG
ncbi:MAG TPA: c-type cytochrome [Acidimicrobiia bacterium]|nr:c-type cytochrome [Acidimicrobiia bacterium]